MRDVILIGSMAIALMGWFSDSTLGPARGGDVEQAKEKPCKNFVDPVICRDGVVYDNLCFARNAGAHNCKPFPLQ